jgi:hypothetical protein
VKTERKPTGVLTKMFLSLLLFGVVAVLLINGLLRQGIAQSVEGREVEDKIPKHVPIKVEIRSEKEKAFKDLKNEKWLGDLEIEVTNTSDKPIYFLELWADLPEIFSENNRKIGFSLRYGRKDFIDFNTRPIPNDVPIRPGETYTFKIAENYQRAWDAHKARGNWPNPRKVEIKFIQMNFGDGTGFNGTDAQPYPYQRDQSSTGSCPKGPLDKS